jgi:hypothetical protein
MAATLANMAKEMSQDYALHLLIDAAAFVTVFEGEQPEDVTDRFNKSYTTILTAKEHIQFGGGRA